jgi:hypothetical protein
MGTECLTSSNPSTGLAANPLGRRVGGNEFGVLAFERFQFPVQGVVLGVGDLRRVLDVVAAVVVADLLPQVLQPSTNVYAFGHAGIIRTDTPDRSPIPGPPEGLPSIRHATFRRQTVTETLSERGRRVIYL